MTDSAPYSRIVLTLPAQRFEAVERARRESVVRRHFDAYTESMQKALVLGNYRYHEAQDVETGEMLAYWTADGRIIERVDRARSVPEAAITSKSGV